MNGVALYFRYASVSLRSQLQYRASAVMQSIGAFMITAIDFLGILALFARFGHIRGWELPEIALFYGMVSISWALTDAFARGFEVAGQIIKAGDFDRVLLPRSPVLQMLGYELTVRRIGRLVQGTAVLTYAFVALDVTWTVPKVLLIAASIAGTICVFLGLVIMQATSAFWATETLEVWNAFTYGGVTMAQYPLAIYRPWFQKLFIFAIPLGCANYFPGLAILGHADPLGTPVWLQWTSPLAGPLFLVLALGVFRLGIRRYTSTGT
jgi:ABC-2 type transport system permease protein